MDTISNYTIVTKSQKQEKEHKFSVSKRRKKEVPLKKDFRQLMLFYIMTQLITEMN